MRRYGGRGDGGGGCEFDGEEGGGGGGDAEGGEGVGDLVSWMGSACLEDFGTGGVKEGRGEGGRYSSMHPVQFGKKKMKKKMVEKMKMKNVGMGRGWIYIIIRPQSKHNLAVHIPTLQPAVEVIVRGAENGCEGVRGGYDLQYIYNNTRSAICDSFQHRQVRKHARKEFGSKQASNQARGGSNGGRKRREAQRTTLASIRAYSKSGLPLSNWSRRKDAFWRSV